MKAVVSVVGKDKVGIMAGVTALCAENGANILDITQSVIGEYFAMIMLTDIDHLKGTFADFAGELEAYGKEKALEVRAVHEDIFNVMYHV